MTVWADSDSLAPAVRATIARRARNEATRSPEAPRLLAVFIANRRLPEKPGPGCSFEVVPKGETADDRIAARAVPGDLVVTRDIPLAARIVEAGIACINDRGAEWSADSVRERLSLRDAMAELRSMGLAESLDRSRGFGEKELKKFADAFDRSLARLLKG
ncbi:MAG: DUF188 domain-containing protein [Spirochaetales bacterium]|nr:DUF188 domain-containing protein [Spirochaetales bacterium]